MKRMLERMNHVLLAVAVLAVLSLTSCEHKDLCHDSLHVVREGCLRLAERSRRDS